MVPTNGVCSNTAEVDVFVRVVLAVHVAVAHDTRRHALVRPAPVFTRRARPICACTRIHRVAPHADTHWSGQHRYSPAEHVPSVHAHVFTRWRYTPTRTGPASTGSRPPSTHLYVHTYSPGGVTRRHALVRPAPVVTRRSLTCTCTRIHQVAPHADTHRSGQHR